MKSFKENTIVIYIWADWPRSFYIPNSLDDVSDIDYKKITKPKKDDLFIVIDNKPNYSLFYHINQNCFCLVSSIAFQFFQEI